MQSQRDVGKEGSVCQVSGRVGGEERMQRDYARKEKGRRKVLDQAFRFSDYVVFGTLLLGGVVAHGVVRRALLTCLVKRWVGPGR